jgi:hypothetical protein
MQRSFGPHVLVLPHSAIHLTCISSAHSAVLLDSFREGAVNLIVASSPMRSRSASTASRPRDGSDLYTHLTREELQRVHASLYGHASSLREKTVAHAITLKASSVRRPPSSCGAAKQRVVAFPTESAAVTRVDASCSQKQVRPISASKGSRAVETRPLLKLSRAVWNRLTAPQQTLSGEMQAWAQGMGANIDFPLQAADVRRCFLRMPLNSVAQEQWRQACERGDVRVLNSLRSCIVHSSAGGGRPRVSIKPRACWCTSNSKRKSDHEDAADASENHLAVENNASGLVDKINAALSHWKLNRVIEQGHSYLYHVCPGSKNRATALAVDLSGTYIVPDGAFIEEIVAGIKKQRAKLRLIQALNHRSADDVDDNGGEPSDVGDEPDYTKEEADYIEEKAREPSDLFQFSTIEVTLKENNLLSLNVHLSDAQVRFLMKGAKEEDPGSRSTFAFVAEAVCIGEDCWFMITGMWRKRLVWVLRDTHNPAVVDSIIIDGICWEKRRFDDGAKATDPFQCLECGNIRRSDNVAYSSRNTSTIRRGNYRCLICGVPTVHVSLRTDATFQQRQRWDPTSGNPLAVDLCMSSKEVEGAGARK